MLARSIDILSFVVILFSSDDQAPHTPAPQSTLLESYTSTDGDKLGRRCYALNVTLPKIKQTSRKLRDGLDPYFEKVSLSLCAASRILALWPKAEQRMKPSPAGPKPLPGVTTMSHLVSTSVNTSQESRPVNYTHT